MPIIVAAGIRGAGAGGGGAEDAREAGSGGADGLATLGGGGGAAEAREGGGGGGPELGRAVLGGMGGAAMPIIVCFPTGPLDSGPFFSRASNTSRPELPSLLIQIAPQSSPKLPTRLRYSGGAPVR